MGAAAASLLLCRAVLALAMAVEGSTPGRLFLITGPSGVGKGTLVAALLQRHPQIWLSISATTRAPRAGEVDRQHYFFLSRPQFEADVAADGLLEWAEFAGNCYGTPRRPVEEQLLSLGVRDDGHDDLADSVSQAVCHVHSTGPMRISTVHYGRGTEYVPADPFEQHSAAVAAAKSRRLTL